jgi:predicted outer membrane repeat protein
MRNGLIGLAVFGALSLGLSACHTGTGTAPPAPAPTPSACLSATPPPGALTVTSTADAGAGSLRDTLMAASRSGVIVFASPLAGATISVSSGPLNVNTSVTLDGPCPSVAISGTASTGASLVSVNSGATAVLANLTLTSSGVPALAVGTGAAVSATNLSILNSTANACAALTVAIDGVFEMNTGAISKNRATAGAGVICNSGRFGALNTSFSGNTTSGDGAFDNSASGIVSIQQSEFDTNKAGGKGGALALNGGSAAFINTTFYNNSSGGNGGAIFVAPGASLILNFDTIVSNSSTPAQVYNAAPATGLVIHNTIVDTLVATNDVSGPITSEGYNFIYNTTLSTGWIGSDILHQALSLYPFGNYGGPTSALPPEKGARVIDAADPANGFPPVDQRGVPRPQGSAPDIGSIEYNPSKPP